MRFIEAHNGFRVGDRVELTVKVAQYPEGTVGIIDHITQWQDDSIREGSTGKVTQFPDGIDLTVRTDDGYLVVVKDWTAIKKSDATQPAAVIAEPEECPSCSHTGYSRASWYRVCDACGAHYGVAPSHKALDAVIQGDANAEEPNQTSFSFWYIDGYGVTRRIHGWYNPESGLVSQWG